jgi:hypothetical protein
LLREVDQPTAASTIPDLQFGQRSVQKMVWADIRALCANQRRPRDDAAFVTASRAVANMAGGGSCPAAKRSIGGGSSRTMRVSF